MHIYEHITESNGTLRTQGYSRQEGGAEVAIEMAMKVEAEVEMIAENLKKSIIQKCDYTCFAFYIYMYVYVYIHAGAGGTICNDNYKPGTNLLARKGHTPQYISYSFTFLASGNNPQLSSTSQCKLAFYKQII